MEQVAEFANDTTTMSRLIQALNKHVKPHERTWPRQVITLGFMSGHFYGLKDLIDQLSGKNSVTVMSCPFYRRRRMYGGSIFLPTRIYRNGKRLATRLHWSDTDQYFDGWSTLNVMPVEVRLDQLKGFAILFNDVRYNRKSHPDYWYNPGVSDKKTWHIPGLRMNMTFAQFCDTINKQHELALSRADHKVDESTVGC